MLVRAITSHKVNGLNDALTIVALGGRGPGGANHHYKIWPAELDTFDVCSDPDRATRLMRACAELRFQQGNPADAINGISNESLLAILEDRLAGFQAGPFKSTEGELALYHVRQAQTVLKERTQERTARGVEGQQVQ